MHAIGLQKKEFSSQHRQRVATLSASNQRRLEQLFDQQMWCWGRDATCPSGNLLLAFGFTRTPPPKGSALSSSYDVELTAGARLTLNSVGLHYAADPPLCFSRGPLAPQLSTMPVGALQEVLRWLAGYERWVAGWAPDWRPAALAARSRRAIFQAPAVPEWFETLAGAVGP